MFVSISNQNKCLTILHLCVNITLGDSMKEKLTEKQSDTLTFIKKFIAKHGYAPSVREICKGLGLSSPATVFVHIKKLEEKGYEVYSLARVKKLGKNLIEFID